VAYYRPEGRVLITGDAVLTVDAETPWGFLSKKRRLFGPPWYVTVDRKQAKQSIARLADLEPLVVAGGHGVPLAGPDVPAQLRALAGRRR
jgi:glyoxylase-like metal-dependent hydrolase (beta-lactamase superfamily II)